MNQRVLPSMLLAKGHDFSRAVSMLRYAKDDFRVRLKPPPRLKTLPLWRASPAGLKAEPTDIACHGVWCQDILYTRCQDILYTVG